MTTAMIANVNREKNSKAFEPTDFMFSHIANKQITKQSWEEQLSIAKSICAIQNKKGDK